MFHSADGSSRDQNSVILLKKSRYIDVVDVTNDIMTSILAADQEHEQGSTDKTNTLSTHTSVRRSLKKSIPVADGDLLVLSAYDTHTKAKYLFASFHGDTNGLATIPVVS